MSHYVSLYVKTCNLCMQTKLQHCKPHHELHPTETLEEQWDTITIDFVVELPNAHSYDVIMNIVNSVGKGVYFMPTHTMVNAEGTAWFYLKEVCKLHRLPAQSGVIADHSLLQTLHANCIGCSRSSSQHPQHITHRQMARLSMSTRKWSSSYISL